MSWVVVLLANNPCACWMCCAVGSQSCIFVLLLLILFWIQSGITFKLQLLEYKTWVASFIWLEVTGRKRGDDIESP